MIKRYDYYDKFKNFLCFIKVDENCNLKCSFCYQGEKKQAKMDNMNKLNDCLYNLDFAIDRFLKIRSEERYENSTLSICFFGGEPTLNPWAIKKICEHLKKYPESVRKSFNVTMTSNGIIYDEDIIRDIASVNTRKTGIMISSDNSKEVYDKNRKLVGSDKSGYEIVQENIKKYRKLLTEINGRENERDVTIATVLATPEQLKNNPLLIQQNFKDVTRRGKLLYDLSHQPTDYQQEAINFLREAYGNLIGKCTLENKEESIQEITDTVFVFGYEEFSECNSIFTIDANGDVNWCSKHRHFDKEILPQNIMRDISIFNRNTDNTHFQCVKDKFAGGKAVKDVIRPELWQQMISLFDPNVPIPKLNISPELETSKYLYNFIKFMVGSTGYEERAIYLENPSEDITRICDEENILISKEFLESNEENIFYIDKNGDLYFDKSLADDKKYKLTNIYEKHFMWTHTPTLLESINKFFEQRIKEV